MNGRELPGTPDWIVRDEFPGEPIEFEKQPPLVPRTVRYVGHVASSGDPDVAGQTFRHVAITAERHEPTMLESLDALRVRIDAVAWRSTARPLRRRAREGRRRPAAQRRGAAGTGPV